MHLETLRNNLSVQLQQRDLRKYQEILLKIIKINMHGTILHQETELLENFRVSDIIATILKMMFAAITMPELDLGTLKQFTEEKT